MWRCHQQKPDLAKSRDPPGLGARFLELLSTKGLQCSSFLVMTYFLLRDYNILPKKELQWSPWEMYTNIASSPDAYLRSPIGTCNYMYTGTGTFNMPKIVAQYPTVREYRQYRLHCFGAILPILSVLGYRAITLGILGGPGNSLKPPQWWGWEGQKTDNGPDPGSATPRVGPTPRVVLLLMMQENSASTQKLEACMICIGPCRRCWLFSSFQAGALSTKRIRNLTI